MAQTKTNGHLGGGNVIGPDGLVEGEPAVLEDTGCAFFPHCLSCPVPQCFHEEESGRSFIKRAAPVLRECWTAQEADRPLLFKAAGVLLESNAESAARAFGPEFMEVLARYAPPQE